MRKTLLTLGTVLCLGAVANAQSLAEKIAGQYTGALAIEIAQPITEESASFPDRAVVIEATSEKMVTFKLENFSFEDMSLGDIILENIPVSEDESGTVHFGENAAKSFVFLNGMIVATAKIDETTSMIKDGNAVIDVNVVWVNSAMFNQEPNLPINVRFTGAKDGDDNPVISYDLNRDNRVDVGDVTLLVTAVLASNSSVTFDLNGDSTIDVGDVTTLVGAILRDARP